jgi:tetratricopeptide (TPR) repeat protein
LATAGADGVARVYTLQVEELIKLALSSLTRSFTEDECRKHLHTELYPPLAKALECMVKAKELARIRDMEGAAASFREARDQAPPNFLTLISRLNPELEVQRFAADALVTKGRILARTRRSEEAINSFREAIELYPSLHLDPEKEVSLWQSSGVLPTYS